MLRATRLASAALTTVLALTQTKFASAQSQSGVPLVQIQSSEKTLTIEVVDPTGARIPKAEISLVDDTPHTKWAANGEGLARITGLSPGPHTFLVEAAGFVPHRLRLSGAPDTLTVRLEVGVLVMGGPVGDPIEPHIETATMSASLTMPAQTNIPEISKPRDNRSAFRRFFSKLGRIF